METHLLAVGKLRPYYRLACDDYLKRLRRYTNIEERELKEAARAPTSAHRRREETARVEAAIPPRATVVVLAIGGAPWSSEELARRLTQWRTSAVPVALVIGGAVGLDPAFIARAPLRWSLGALTLPHELVRVIVAEQWYRAWTIVRGEPYHKGGER
jgi:23S rRNA (pseudouridine1915-N3)-methyltransferase